MDETLAPVLGKVAFGYQSSTGVLDSLRELEKLLIESGGDKLEAATDAVMSDSGQMSGWLAGKPIIALDFDGVIHSYKGWNDGKLGDPIPGAIQAIEKLIAGGNRVIIFSTREPDTIKPWLREHGLAELEVTNRKPPFVVLLDDRAVTFEGFWTPELIERLQKFAPYWERDGVHIL